MRRFLVPGLLTAVVLALVLADRYAPRPVDWTPSYEHDASVPLGGAVIHTLLPRLVGAEVRTPAEPLFRFLRADAPPEETVFILTADFAPDSLLAEALADYARRGGTVFIAATHLSGTIERRLGIETERRMRRDSVLHLAHASLARPDGFALGLATEASALRPLDPKRPPDVLGTTADGEPVFARVPLGEGAVFVLAAPRALSNAALLDSPDGPDFAAAALAYLPSRPVRWDRFNKPQRGTTGSVLRYVHEHPALAWAWYTALAGALLFVVLGARRRTRPIPRRRVPPNHAVGYAEALGRLHRRHGGPQRLVTAQTADLLARLRLALHAPELAFDDAGRARIAEALGVPIEEVAAFADLAERLRDASSVSEADLLAFDRRLHALSASVNQ